MTPGSCHACGQEVYYVATNTGKTITIDKIVSAKGTIIFEGSYAVEIDEDDPWEQEMSRYTSHAKTCPRRRRKQ